MLSASDQFQTGTRAWWHCRETTSYWPQDICIYMFVNVIHIFVIFTQMSLIDIYRKLVKWIGHDSTPLMPVPGRNQSDALWVRPLPGRYLLITQWHCRETTTHWVLINWCRWYRYTDTALFMEKTWNGMVPVPGSNPLIYQTMPVPDRNQSDAYASDRFQTDTCS